LTLIVHVPTIVAVGRFGVVVTELLECRVVGVCSVCGVFGAAVAVVVATELVLPVWAL
jgi:hypothetical protein